LAHISFWS